jgi:RHS repeat-associated protein
MLVQKGEDAMISSLRASLLFRLFRPSHQFNIPRLPRTGALFLVPVALLALVFSASAQIENVTDSTSTPIPGAGHDYIKMFSETVNPANGSVSIRIQTPTPSGRGISLPFSFAYDSNGASHVTTDGHGLTSWVDNNAYLSRGGWSYSTPVLSNVDRVVTIPGQPGHPPRVCTFANDYVLQDATGGRHSLGVSYLVSSVTSCSGIASNHLTGGDDYYKATLGTSSAPVVDSAGTVYTFPLSGNQGGGGSIPGAVSSLPSTIEDRNGNQIVVTDRGSSSFTVTDTLGRTLLTSSGFGASGNTMTVSSLRYSTTWGTSNLNYSANASLLFNGSGKCYSSFNSDTGTNNVITQITLPNTQFYQFSYDSTYGVVNQITYPTGGYVQYVWGLNDLSEAADFEDSSGGSSQCYYHYDAPVVAHRYVSFDGTHTALTQDFTYSTTWSSDVRYWTTKTTTVKTTDNITGAVSTTVYTYTPINAPYQPNDSREFSSQIPLEETVVYENSASSTMRTDKKTWFDQYEIKSQQTELENALTNQTTYTYGPGAQITDKQEYDYGSGAPGTFLRETVTNYQSFGATPTGGTILNKPCQNIVYDGSRNRYSETDYFYDNGSTGTVCGTAGTPSVTGISGLTEHDETNYGPSSTAPRGNLTQKTQWSSGGSSPVTTYTYDETGHVLSTTDPCGNATCSDMTGATHTTSYSYSNSYTVLSGGQNVSYTPGGNTDAYLTTITDPLGHTANFTYDYNNGQLTVSKDQNVQTTSYLYNDAFARPTQFSYPDGGQTEHAYNDSPPSPSVTTCQLINGTAGATCSAASPPTGWKTSVAVMDGLGHVVQTQLASDPDGVTYTATIYNGFAQPYTVTNPYRSTGDSTYGVTTQLYDARKRPCLVVPPDFAATAPTTCPATAPAGSTFTSYSGNQTTVTDETGNQRASQTDGLGRLTNVVEAPNNVNYNYQTAYAYDPLNNLLSVNQAGSRARTFTYDSLSRLLCAVTCPTSGTTFPAGAITYSYDLNGNLSSKVAPRPNQTTGTTTETTNYSYDVLNRLTQKSYVGVSTATAKFGYDGTTLTSCGQNPPTITSPTNLVGRRSAMCAGQSGSAWSYDPMGRTLVDDRTNNGSSAKTYASDYTYYKDGSLNTLTYPSGDVVTYTVGSAGRATYLSDASNNYVGYSNTPAKYAPNGSLAGMTNGHTGTFAGIVTSNVYNDRLQPILLSAGVGGNSIFSLCYDFHLGVAVSSAPCSFNAYTTGDNGNVFQVLNTIDATRSAAYIYDPLNRIAQAYTVNTTSTNCWGETYSPTASAPGVLPSTPGIDAWSNLTNRSGVSGMTNCATEPLNAPANTQNHLTGLSYDIAGNVLNDGNGNTPTYDAENRIATDAGVTYSYDADGVRMEKSSGTMYWPGSAGTLTETNLSGTINEEYIYFNGARIARVDRPSGAVHYYFSNHLDSHSVIVSATGSCEQDIDYYPYGGLVTDHCPTVGQHYKFTGKERDTESNLDQFGARYYGSGLGRYMTPDWAAKATAVPFASFGNPQTLNLYSYVQNNPLSKFDDDGHATIEIRYNSIGPGYTHSYIIVTDRDGSQKVFRAGPSHDVSPLMITPATGGSSSQSSGSQSSASDSSNSSSPGSAPTANGDPWGKLVGVNASYVPGAPDYTTTPAASSTLLSNDLPAAGYTSQLQQYQNSVNGSDIPYNPLSTNSNAYAAGAANSLGLTVPKPPVWAPGAGTTLPVTPAPPPPPTPPPPSFDAGDSDNN